MAYNGPRGTGFTSLAQYLNLNREASQRMGDEIVSDVNARGAGAEGAIKDYGQKFLGQAAAGTPTYNAQGVDTEEKAKALANAAQYKGPTEWDAETAKNLGTQAADASQRARMATSEYGRGTLLQQRYAPNGGYTAGAAGLDSFLAGRGAGNRTSEANTKWGQLQSMLTGEQKSGADAVKAAQEAAATVKGKYEDLARSLHRDPSKPPTKPYDAAYQARLDNATRARGEEVVAPENRVTPDRKGGGGDNEDPNAETDNAAQRRRNRRPAAP